jgi:hypothetical protein
VAGAGLYFVLGGSAGLLALGAVIAACGTFLLHAGLGFARAAPSAHSRDRFYFSRIGLYILGGFVAAAMILLSNWVVMALSATTR